ncbi:limonene-1,2-epoxide hydrolase family protein [Streptomyces sp. DSM 44917]|uniref:Limonene-1,2-epoxide hydrolase family protein n=1 Tax=Streptomyces boetiae TaxID=3075541 RepID=A0ABU2L840_9ACTN|nr:limonene-1,2-epoxide hydrolase family protein [Streptomyces sp. DSM 44917]MDT0307735.1 limonene-1,2-epoxide hydrolase family protein [Streptomyces sp. DSM 44917]
MSGPGQERQEDRDDPVRVVTAFLEALEELDADRALTFLAPGVLYQNVSLPSVRGRRAVGRVLRLLARTCTDFEARVHRVAGNGPVVLTERTDVLVFGAFRARFWVCGIFEVHDGRITLWRDYFDWLALLRGAAGGALRAAVIPARRARAARAARAVRA